MLQQDSQKTSAPRQEANSGTKDTQDRQSSSVRIPAIETPKGGGAISSIGEKFQANPVTGTGSMSVPVAVSPGRSGFTPELALQYDSGSGNGIFGMGWNIPIPSITRKTQKGLPKYRDAEDSDIFLMSGAEDLVPALKEDNGDWIKITRTEGDYHIQQYRPRIEGAFAKIEKYTDQSSNVAHWRATTRDNVTSVYGISNSARVSHPDDNTKVFEWLLEYTYNEKGNIILYEYKQEDNIGIDGSLLSERNRLNNTAVFNKKYVKTIKYTPDTPFDPTDSNYFNNVNWHFQVVFDYGEHNTTAPTVSEINDWAARQDAFSNYRAGFEIRTYRLCQRILMFHHFSSHLGTDPYLVKSTDISYDENPIASRVLSIKHQCYQSGETPADYPSVDFQYSQASIDKNIHQYDIADTENLPIGVDGAQYRWTDLHGEGLPGVLIEDPNAWYFKKNLGDENYYKDLAPNLQPAPEARLAPVTQIGERPSLAKLGNTQITDLDGDGTQDLVINTPEIAGYYARSKDGKWKTFEAFEANPNINWNDPNLRLIDIDGDGFADVLLTENNCFVCYPSLAEKGYGTSYETLKSFDEENGPSIIFADPDQSVYLADMSGDGLADIVRIKNGSVCYWPNLGYGRFGLKVSMDNAPWFDHNDIFNQQRIRLADVDGSGTSDIIYIAEDCIKYFPNQSGNRLGNEIIINQRLPTHNLTNIATLDILGNGTQCLVWSSPVAGDHPPAIKFIDLMGGIKPYLLTEVNNNMGSITRLKYAPSTKFYLRDEREGKPWITKLPFPVQVVERVEMWDEVNRNRFVTRYAYHHGYFDGVEREFRGFGMVEQWDSETFTDFINEGLFPPGYNANEEVLHIPPVHTKTWFHTGFFQEGKKILGQYESEYWDGDSEGVFLDHNIPGFIPGSRSSSSNLGDPGSGAGVTSHLREAARALKGSPLRQEVYSLDGSAEEGNPYTVTENNYTLKRVQLRGSKDRRDNDYASFLVTPLETLAYQYERNPTDPRISHQMVLETDLFGNTLKSAAIGYGRRASQSESYDEQDTTLITITENTVINVDDSSDFYRLGVTAESKNYQFYLSAVIPAPEPGSPPPTPEELLIDFNNATEISFEETPDGSLQKRLINHSRILYYDENPTSTPLAFGQVASHALPFESYQLALTAGLITNTLNENTTRVDGSVLNEGEYRDLLNNGNYWVPSGKVTFDDTHFYLPTVQEDPFGNQTTLQYDSYYLFPTQTTDAIGNVTQAQLDYRILQPDLVTDPNGNRQAFAFDVRGMVSKLSVMGKSGDSDGDTLSDPTTTFEYDLFRWQNEQKPNFAKTRTRETHADVNTRWQESYAYSDGLGQVVMTKTKVAPGDAFSRDGNGDLLRDGNDDLILANADPRWVGNGRTILDNKGNPIKQYEPYFSSTFEYETEAELVEYGVTPVIYYDPLGRAIRTELPDDTITKVAFTPWQQANYDQNDTVLESLWYVARNSPDPGGSEPPSTGSGGQEERAAWLAAQHANTPQIVKLDGLGRPFLTIDDNASDGDYEMTTELDIQGNPLSITDAKGRESFTYTYDLLNQALKTTHLDNGTRYAISNVVGNPLRAWDDRDQLFIFQYDELQRPTHTRLGNTVIPDPDPGSPSNPYLISLTVYGEAETTPENNNLRGQAYLIFDSAGLVKNTSFDFKGNLLSSTRQLATTYQTSPDWNSLNETSVATILSSASSLLESETFTVTTAYDALNRPTSVTQPDSSEVLPAYDQGGQLEAVSCKLRGAGTATDFVNAITYNARGQRKYITYSNGSHTTYHYDTKTFRLTRLITTRNSGADILQDLNYTYDPVGNIVEQIDNAQQTFYYDNTEVSPNGKYIYDTLYRLLQAEGRELIGLNAPGNTDISISPLPNDSTAMRLYTQQYEYDSMGNIEKITHTASSGNWTKHYHYASNNYLLSRSNNGTQGSDEYTYDAHGNMTAMPHLSSITWDYADRMQSADLGGGGDVFYTYDVGGNRVRKVIDKGSGLIHERIYLGDFEVYREIQSSTIQLERETLHINDDTGRIALVNTKTIDGGSAVGSPTSDIRYQFSNHLGSAALELDDSASIISYEEYHPFGSTSYRSGANSTEVSLKRYRYVGKERDDETGLYYYGARYYAPWLARFVSVDPLKDDYPQLNSFNYADNNPASDLDIDGRQNTKSQKRLGGIPEIPQFPNITSNLGDFVNETRPDLRQKFNKQTSKEGKRAVTNEAKIALGNFIEQTRTNLRSQLKQDFFIDKIDGQYKFDTKAALNAFKGSGLSNKDVISTISTIKNRASDILNDSQFDTFVFESQGAKAEEAKRAYKEMLEERRAQAALDKEIQNILNPGSLGVVGQGVGLFGDFVEVAGEGLTASIFLGEAGVPIIFIGKGISALGTGIEIADDYQRLDPELAQELAGIRGAVLLVSEGIGLPGAKKALSEGIIKEKLEQVVKSSGQKFLQRRAEQELIDISKKNSISQ